MASGGNCDLKKDIDVACPQQDACADPNAICSSTCQCNTGFYNNNGTCDPLLCVGETCNTTSDCRGNNVECSGSPQTCRCPADRYIDVESGDCLSKKSNGESCELGQCATSNAFCDPNTNTCSCVNGYYDTNGMASGGNCDLKKGIDVACSQQDACADPNAICSSTCQCNTGFYNNNGTCDSLLCVGETCNTTSDCQGNNVECSGSPQTCRCPADRYLDVESGDCLSKRLNGQSCEPGQCATSNAICDPNTDTCTCANGYYDTDGVREGGDCDSTKALDVACTLTESCADINAICRTTCQCDTGYYNNAGTCEPLLCVGQSCSSTIACRGNNTECSGSPSICRCPDDRYFDIESGDCLPRLDFGAGPCQAGQCTGEGVVCNPTTDLCDCANGLIYDTIQCIECPDSGWEAFNGSCYFFGTTELNYAPAFSLCSGFTTDTVQSNLVQVDTVEELAYLKNFMTTRAIQPSSGYFNDLYQVTTDGNEAWLTSMDPLVVSDWNPGQPLDNAGQDQRCTIFLRTWNYRQGDFDCATRRSIPLCEASPK